MSEYEAIGYHARLEGQFFDDHGKPKPNFEWLDNSDRLLELISRHIELAGATILNVYAHQFEPQGVTINWTLSESHATIHTCPEHGSYFLDMFTCGTTIKPGEACILIADTMGGSYECHVDLRKPPGS